MKIKNLKTVEIILAIMLVMFFIGSLFSKKEEKIEEETVVEKIELNTDAQIDYTKINSISNKYSYEDNNYTSMFGIDVSEFNGNIDWQKVKDDNVQFVYIRIGRRGASTGLLYDDDMFDVNYEGAKAVGLKIGVYFFSQAYDIKEAIDEARWVLNKIADKQLELPIVLDCEEVYLENEEPRISNLNRTQHTNNALAFLNEIQTNGYQAMLYTYPYWANNYYEIDRFKDFPIWLAYYDENPDVEFGFTMWQYSNTGTINGIKGDTDLDIMFIPKD